MLNQEDNELLTRLGPGMPMGKLMREYWLPALSSDELPAADGDPLRVRLLGENLIAFRETGGRVGLIQNHCPHRGASLFFGRNEEGGLRCVYHGWKFDALGACTDMPNEPAESDFKSKVKAVAYPCVERNGVVWVYMGPRASPPALPDVGWSLVPVSQRSALRYVRDCNWLQALEGDIDSSHVNFLHRSFVTDATGPRFFYSTERDRLNLQYFRAHSAPVLSVSDTEAGVAYGARRPAAAGEDFWRVTQFHLPFYTSIPGAEQYGSGKVWIPLDDEHTLVWEAHWSLTGHDFPVEQRDGRDRRLPASGYLPNTSGWMGRWRFAANRGNDYFIDREKQKTVNYTGLDVSNPLQDAAVQESMGPILDRSIEHLGSADAMVIRVRRRLLSTLQAHTDSGYAPGVDQPALYRYHGVQFVLPHDGDWLSQAQTLSAETVPA